MDPSSWYVDIVSVYRRTGVKTTIGAKGDPVLKKRGELACRVERGDFTFRDVTGGDVAADARLHTDANALAEAGVDLLRVGRDWIVLPGGPEAGPYSAVVRVDTASTKDGSETTYQVLLG